MLTTVNFKTILNVKEYLKLPTFTIPYNKTFQPSNNLDGKSL